MKNILIIVLCFFCVSASAQWTRPNTSYGNRQYRISLDSTLLIPTGSAAAALHAADLGMSAIYYRTGVGLYVYNPTTQTWSLLGSGGSGTTVVSFSKNAGRDSIILVLSDGARYAVKDSLGTGTGSGSSSALANFYLKDSLLSSDRTVDLNGHTLDFTQGGISYLRIMPAGDNGVIIGNNNMRSIQISDDISGINLYGGTNGTNILINDNTQNISLTGDLQLNSTTSGSTTDSILTQDPTTKIVHWRDAASLGVQDMQQTYDVNPTATPTINAHDNFFNIDSISALDLNTTPDATNANANSSLHSDNSGIFTGWQSDTAASFIRASGADINVPSTVVINANRHDAVSPDNFHQIRVFPDSIKIDGGISTFIVIPNLDSVDADPNTVLFLRSDKSVAYGPLSAGSGSSGLSNFKTFNTIAALIATAGDSTPYATVLGFYAPNDGGGGDFYFDAASTAASVNGVIIQPTGVTTGRMKRIAKTNWNLKWFGAKGIGISGYKFDSAAFAQSFAYFKLIGGYNTMRMPASDSPYCLAGLGFVMPSNFKLYGDGEDKTRLLNINTNFADNYLNGTGFFIGTYSTDPTHNLSRVPRYRIYNVGADQTWIRLRNIADASNFTVGELINPSSWAYNKDGDAGKTIWRKFTYALITRKNGDTLFMNEAAGMDVDADNSAYALYEVTNGITAASDTGSAVVFRPNAGTTTNSHLGTDRMGVNITLSDFTYSVSPHDFVRGTDYDSSIVRTPGNVVSLGSGYNIRMKNLCLNAYGNFGGQYMSNWEVQNVNFQTARKIIDVGNGSKKINVHNCNWDYWNEFHDTSSTAMFYLNNYSWKLDFTDLTVSGGFKGNNFIQVDGAHDVHFSGLNAKLPNYNSAGSDIIHITTEDTVLGTFAHDNTFDHFDITTMSCRRYISYVGQPHNNFKYNGNVVFNDLTFRSSATNAFPFYFSDADSLFVSNLQSATEDSLKIVATTYIRNLFVAAGSGSGGSGSNTKVDSVVVDFDGLHAEKTIPLTRSGFKNLEVQAESEGMGRFEQDFDATEAILTWQAAIKGTFKIYFIYTF